MTDKLTAKIKAQAEQIDRQAELIQQLRKRELAAGRTIEELRRRLDIAKGAKG
jgi:hypothetical protein